MRKNCFLLLLAACVSFGCFAQDVNALLKEAVNFERTQKEDEALLTYQKVLQADRNNLQALIKSAALSCAVGARQADKKARLNYFNQAKGWADAALLIDSNSADANYVRAVVATRFADVETDNKKVVENLRDVKAYADKALAIDPNHARANYVLGKWNFDMVNQAWAKRAALKLLHGGVQPASIENAFKYMEKARQLDQYYVLNYLDLAKAYKYDDKPAKAIEVLTKLVKLPTRTADDVSLKEEGRKMLNEMQ